MKLRYGEKFGIRAGSCWRLLFVYVLMPWLHQYRVSARPSIAEGIDDRPNDPASMVPGSMLSISQNYLETRGSFVGTPGSLVGAPSSFVGTPESLVGTRRESFLQAKATSIRSRFTNNLAENEQDSATRILELEQEIERLKDKLRNAEQETVAPEPSMSDVKDSASQAFEISRSMSEDTV